MPAVDVPQYHELLWPAVQSVFELGGSASIGEIVETVIKREGFSDEQQAVLHNDGPETEIGYRLAWGRAYLKRMGLLTNSARGVWALTDDGTTLLTDRALTDDERRDRVRALWSSYVVTLRKARKSRPSRDQVDEVPAELTDRDAPTWKEQLLDAMMAMPRRGLSAWHAACCARRTSPAST